MANKNRRSSERSTPGVWNRGTGHGPHNPIRVRTKRLDEINGDKIALAYWLLAKQLVANGTGKNVTEEEAQRIAKGLDDRADAGSAE